MIKFEHHLNNGSSQRSPFPTVLFWFKYTVGQIEYRSQLLLVPNQVLLKSLNINIETVDLIFSGNDFHKFGARPLRVLAPYFVAFGLCTNISCLL